MLLYKTKNNTSPQGKQKVYFCCHPQDFPLYFESLSDEILGVASCSIWYSPTTPFHHDEEFYHDLTQMTLVVIPVTARLLNTDNPIIREEIPYILDRHIPILPILQETGLDAAFSKVFYELQYLDRCSQDDTAISYTEKLKKHLTNVLVEDEKRQRIQNTFFAQLFLSYRKKDRRYAHNLMERIHAHKPYRDVAIWYDEFLTPGEDFNRSIEMELNKSDAFVMAVTPNLVNEANYIQSVEYPSAKKANKPIVPVEMVSADKSLLAAQYDGIPSCVSATDNHGLQQAVGRVLPARVASAGEYDAEHDYLIGMAYLHGISVEVNRSIALEMITTAAENGHAEAMGQLAHMYRFGDGVKQDLSKAIHWQKALADYARAVSEADRTDHNLALYADTTFALGGLYQQAKKYEEAKQCLHDLILELLCVQLAQAMVGKRDEQTMARVERIRCLALSVLAEIAHSEGDVEEEERLADEAITASLQLNREWNSDWMRRDLSVLYRNKASFFKIKHDIPNAVLYCEKALQVQEQYAANSDEPQFRFDLAYTCNHLSELYRLQENYAAAKASSQRAVQELERLVRDEPTSLYLEYKGVFYLGLAESYRLNGDFEEAKAGLEQVERILTELEEVFGNYQWHTKYYCFLRRAQLYAQRGDNDQIILNAEAALQIQEEHRVIDESQIHTGDASLMTVHYLLSAAYSALGELTLGIEHAEISVRLADQWCGHNLLLIDVESILPYAQYATLLLIDERLIEAKELLARAIRIASDNHITANTMQGSACWFSLWFAYGRLHVMEERTEEAFRCFQKAEECYNTFLQTAPPVTSLEDQITLNYNMGCCLVDDHPSQAKGYLQKTVLFIESIDADKRTLNIWEMLGLSYYFLFMISNVFTKGKWAKKLCGFIDDMDRYYPEEFLQTNTCQVLLESGLFDN